MDGRRGNEEQDRVDRSFVESQDSSASPDSQFSIEAPSIELPKGGGAIRGIGELCVFVSGCSYDSFSGNF